MASPARYGVPLFTEGVFGRASAQDDLGVEEVGAALLRRLLPAIIQNTPNAGYYSFYPYLLWKWEELGGAVERRAFAPFFRRHEAAFAVACSLHEHRDGATLRGVNGANAGGQRARELEEGVAELDLDALAATYMDTELGGYGLFYAATLQEARLVRAGARGLVDRVTERGEAVARAFAEVFEATAYAREHLREGGTVSTEVLRELGDAACLCSVPGRGDHEPLLRTFFGPEPDSPAWEESRLTRVQSLSLLLEFHAQRPAGDEEGLAAWRRALISHRFSGGAEWETSHPERRESWRAYQLRECAVLALTTIWSLYLTELADNDGTTHGELVAELVSWLPPQALSEEIESADDLALEVEPLEWEWRDAPAQAFARALRVLVRLRREIAGGAPGFTELLDEGGPERWSLRYLDGWLAAREQLPVATVAAELLDALHHQHVRVALAKVRAPTAENLTRVAGNWRDPFNFSEDDGVLRVLRRDEPFWSGARYHVGNHLLWTLGLLSSPDDAIRPTELGHRFLAENGGDA
jgi:hypothetical protein